MKFKNMNKDTKQVIVIRRDLKMRRGKEMEQAAHASMAFLTKYLYQDPKTQNYTVFINNDEEVKHWLYNSYRKIVVYVESEEQLMQVYKKAEEKRLLVHLVEDNGATEFNGVKTRTCLCIGPHWDDAFIGITDDLKFY